MAENTWAIVTADLGYVPEEKTNIYLAPSTKELAYFMGDDPHPWLAGAALVEKNIIVLRPGRGDIERTIRHEYTHIVLGKAGGKNLPLFLNEGLAMYEAREWRLWHEFILGQATLTRSLIPLSALFQYPEDRWKTYLSYAESFSILAYILREFGQVRLQELIRELSRGNSINTAGLKALGRDMASLEEEWKLYLKKRYSWISVITSSLFLWGMLSGFLIITYLRRKQQYRKRTRAWEEEEAISTPLQCFR
ncbi:MAG: peptidase MA family metallohydrolase [bacterium]